METKIKNISFDVDSDEALNIKIHGQIGKSLFSGEDGYSLQDLTDEINSQPKFKAINLELCSPGGDIGEGLGIYSVLENFKASGIPVRTRYIGCNASMSTVIGCVSDERLMNKHGLFLVHNGSTGVMGKVEDLEKAADELDRMNQHICQLYCDCTGKDMKDIQKLMDQEKWISADEAKEWGFITKIEGEDEENFDELTKNMVYQINESNLLPKIEFKTLENNNGKMQEFEMKYIELAKVNSEMNAQMIMFKQEIENKNNEISSLKNLIKEKDIDKYLNEQIKLNKISSALKSDYKSLLMTNYDATKNLIDKLVPQRTTTLFQMTNEESVEERYKLETKNPFTEISKKDPEKLAFLYKNNFEEYNHIYKLEFGVDYQK